MDDPSSSRGSMPVAEAFERLGLALDASAEEVRTQYRALAKAHHPDRGGNTEEWQAIESAKEVALGAASRESSTEVALRETHDLARRQAAIIQRLEHREYSERLATGVIRRRTSRLRSRKRTVWAVATVGAVLAGLVQLFRALQTASASADPASAARLDSYTLVLAVLAAFVAASGLLFKFLADRIEHAVEDLTAEMTDPERAAAVVDEIRRAPGEAAAGLAAADPTEAWSRSTFVAAVERWSEQRSATTPREHLRTQLMVAAPPLYLLARRLGPDDAGSLILAKAVEAGLIDQEAPTVGTRRPMYRWTY